MLIPLKLYIHVVQTSEWRTAMKNVSISEFRANLLTYLKQVQQGEQINVTSKGDILATLSSPVSQQESAEIQLRKLAETAKIGDVVSPSGENWDAMK